MAYNKVTYGNEIILDLTEDTVSSESLLEGVTAHDKSGEVVEGEIVDRRTGEADQVIKRFGMPDELAWDSITSSIVYLKVEDSDTEEYKPYLVVNPKDGFYTDKVAILVPGEDVVIEPDSTEHLVEFESDKVITSVVVTPVQGLIPRNVKSGAIIGDVSGTFTDDATLTAPNMIEGVTAYVKGQKITGTMKSWKGIPDHIDASRLKDNQYQVAVHPGYHHYSWADDSYEYRTYSEVANDIGLTAAKIASGNTILGITGTFTNDANAVADFILVNRTAYVNGQKITGAMADWLTNGPDHIVHRRLKDNQYQVAVSWGYHGCNWTGNNKGYEYVTFAQLAEDIGLTADKIVSGNTIIGISGTGGSSGYQKYRSSVGSISYDSNAKGTKSLTIPAASRQNKNVDSIVIYIACDTDSAVNLPIFIEDVSPFLDTSMYKNINGSLIFYAQLVDNRVDINITTNTTGKKLTFYIHTLLLT